jgi:hypothetical protein
MTDNSMHVQCCSFTYAVFNGFRASSYSKISILSSTSPNKCFDLNYRGMEVVDGGHLGL